MYVGVCWLVAFTLACFLATSTAQQSEHLVVLSHGLHGSRHDLTYLSDLLENAGCLVLRSSANEMLNSHAGVISGGSKLSDEVWNFLFMHSGVKKISFVGNSLGGLYARYALKELFDEPTGLMATLQPHRFLVSAPPTFSWQSNGSPSFTTHSISSRLLLLPIWACETTPSSTNTG